ncbi:MAG: NAD(P)/FAD-dependent oxidoreductase [Rhodoglobus sp.]
MNDADLVIVGGGPAGLSCAIEARLAGLTVILIEPRAGEIDKACGEGLMPGVMPLLTRWGIDPPGIPLRGVRYVTASRQAEHLFRLGHGRGVRRTTLHTALSQRAAELGIERLSGRVRSFDHHPSGVVVNGVHAAWLVGADGLHSTVRRAAGLELPSVPAVHRFGLRQHFSCAPWSDLIEVHWGRDAEVYVTPVAENLVGVAVLGPKRTNFEQTVGSIPALAARFSGAEPWGTVRGAGPFRQRARRPSVGRVLLIGDASGYVDAITGEGLRLGFDQARLAVQHILASRGDSRVDNSAYDRQWRALSRDFRRLTSGVVLAATSPLRRMIVPTAATFPQVYGAVVERLAR